MAIISAECSYLFFLFFWLFSIEYCHAFRCQSCFSGCRNFDDCDCDGNELNSTCEAAYCYAKLEYFTDDGISAIQKGCINEISSAYFGCQYASDDRSIACYCSGELCNSAEQLSRYQTPELPLVTCCECNDDESGSENCQLSNCTRNCTGNYCYLDMVANAQGCGWGHPQLFHFIRSQKYMQWSHEMTCAEYYDNYRNYMSGCTCAKDFCNLVADVDQLRNRQRAQSQAYGQHFCYSLYAHSESAFGAEVYRHSSLCPSHFCFLSWTSVEVMFDPSEDEDESRELDFAELGSGEFDYYSPAKRMTLPQLRSNYEISAGCLHVDDEEKVQIGCTIEWSHRQNAPLTKHCVCDEKLCNYFYLIDDPTVTTTTSATTPVTLPPIGKRPFYGQWNVTSTARPAPAPTAINEFKLTSSGQEIVSTSPANIEINSTTTSGMPSTTMTMTSTSPSTSSMTSTTWLDIIESTSIQMENQSFVPVTSAFITSPITEMNSDVNTSISTSPLSKMISDNVHMNEVTITASPTPMTTPNGQRPKGHFRGRHVSHANGLFLCTCLLLILVCTSFSIIHTAIL